MNIREWRIVKVGDVCDFFRGLTYKKTDEVEFSSNAVLRANNITLGKGVLNFGEIKYISDSINIPNSKFVKKNSVLICTASGSKSHLGKTAFVDDDYKYAFGGFMGLLIPRAKLDGKYLYWITASKAYSDFIAELSDGANINNLKFSQLSEFSFPMPSLEEQKRIVAILDEAFAGIDAAIANTEKNLANARELFESYLNLVFTKRGDGWIDQRFGEICSFVRGPFGGSLKKSCFVEEGFAVYEQQHAINDQFESVRYFIDDKKFQEMRRFELFPGDLIMSCSGTMGRVAIVPSTIKRGVINQALLKLTPSDKIDAQYLRLWMESDSFIEEIEKHSQGAAIKNVSSVKVLKEIEVPIPDLSKQKEIVSKILDYREQTNQLGSIYQKKLNSLKELKQSLLQKAFSGELTAKPDKLMDENVA